jgi:hypothetical protein
VSVLSLFLPELAHRQDATSIIQIAVGIQCQMIARVTHHVIPLTQPTIQPAQIFHTSQAAQVNTLFQKIGTFGVKHNEAASNL